MFNSEKYDVIFIEIDSKEIKDLNKKISSELENTDDFPVYKPHVTIAYVKPGTYNNLKGKKPFNGTKLKVGRYWWSPAEGTKTYLDGNND